MRSATIDRSLWRTYSDTAASAASAVLVAFYMGRDGIEKFGEKYLTFKSHWFKICLLVIVLITLVSYLSSFYHVCLRLPVLSASKSLIILRNTGKYWELEIIALYIYFDFALNFSSIFLGMQRCTRYRI